MNIELLNIFTSIATDGVGPGTILSLFQVHANRNSERNFNNCLITLTEKINNSQLNGSLPKLDDDDNNLIMYFLEEMQFTYTEEKRECITNLITNMLHEKKNGTFELYTYQVIFDQLKQMYDPEILLFKKIHDEFESLTCHVDNHMERRHLSATKISKLAEYSIYRLKKLENLSFLENVTGFVAEDTKGEFIYNESYYNTFYNKACSLLYEN